MAARKTSKFGDVLEAAEALSLEDQLSLVEVLRSRTIEERRKQLKREIQSARREQAQGKSKLSSPDEIMKEILK